MGENVSESFNHVDSGGSVEEFLAFELLELLVSEGGVEGHVCGEEGGDEGCIGGFARFVAGGGGGGDGGRARLLGRRWIGGRS